MTESHTSNAKHSFWLRLAAALCLLYVVSVSFLVMSGDFIASPSPKLALLKSFTPFFFLPILLILPLSLLLQSKLILIGALILCIEFSALYGNRFLPNHTLPTKNESTLKVLTFNVGLNLSAAEEIVAIIEHENPDIVSMQELLPEKADYVQNDLDQYPYRFLKPDQGTTALFSRYPIMASRWLNFSEGPKYIYAQIEWENELLHVFVVHPPPPGLSWYKDTSVPIGLHDEAAQQRVSNIGKHMATLEGPRIMTGDFNLSEYTRTYTDLSQTFTDAYKQAGWGFGFTFPNNLRIRNIPIPSPFVRIDYIFHSDELRAEKAYIRCDNNSDHCYLSAELTLHSE